MLRIRMFQRYMPYIRMPDPIREYLPDHDSRCHFGKYSSQQW